MTNTANYLQQIEAAVEQEKILPSAQQNISQWLTEEKYAEYHDEIKKLIAEEKWQDLNDNFFQVIPFGTGGRRGTVGVGSNRINRVTIGESAQALANYLLEQGPDVKEKGIVIARDTRLTGEELSAYAADIFVANGFKTYLFDNFRTTPELAFAVRHLNTASGVVISASHNPPSDNGFKVYWHDGGQIVPPHDSNLMKFGTSVKEIVTSPPANQTAGELIIIGPEVDQAYIKAVLNESLSTSRSAKVVYSPLHGTGITSIQPILEQAGFKISIVESQANPDGHFPNVPNNIPNPEMPNADQATKAQAQAEKADIGITSDPDADRLGIIARDKNGDYHTLNGNQGASLICHYALKQMKKQDTLTKQHFIAKTIVTTDLLDAIAEDYDVINYNNILVGFKYVAELIKLHQDNGDQTFVFGGEESYGSLKGSYTRDKDAAVAALMIAELASTLKDQDTNLIEQLDMLFRKYGIFAETLDVTFFEGANGNEKMSNVMNNLRNNPPTTIGDHTITSIADRLTGDISNPATKEIIDHNDGAKENVLVFNLAPDNRTRITVRPSGTEPKMKMYVQVHKPVDQNISDADLAKEKTATEALAKLLSQDIQTQFKTEQPEKK